LHSSTCLDENARVSETLRDPQVELQLRNVVDGLVNHTQGAFPRAKLTALVDDLYDQMAANAKVRTFLPVLVGRAALTQVRAEQIQAGEVLKTQPEVLLVCQDNIGRSQAAAALLRYYAPGMLYIVSAGVAPKGHVLEEVTNGLAAHGVYLTDVPKPYSQEMLDVADHLIVVGEVEHLPTRDGLDQRQWRDIPHIEGLSAAEVADVLVLIDGRVREVLAQWLPDLDLGDPVMQQSPTPA
jgi:protein-tyrosine-phosphatase